MAKNFSWGKISIATSEMHEWMPEKSIKLTPVRVNDHQIREFHLSVTKIWVPFVFLIFADENFGGDKPNV